MDTLFQNIRVGIRSLRRTPGVALLAGSPRSPWALVFRRPSSPWPTRSCSAASLSVIKTASITWGVAPDRAFDYPVGFSDGSEFIRSSRILEQAALFLYNGAGPVPIRDGDRITRLRRALVSGGFFQVLGHEPRWDERCGPRMTYGVRSRSRC